MKTPNETHVFVRKNEGDRSSPPFVRNRIIPPYALC